MTATNVTGRLSSLGLPVADSEIEHPPTPPLSTAVQVPVAPSVTTTSLVAVGPEPETCTA